MHDLFGEWYRIASIEPTADDLEKRWQGVEKFTETMESEDEDKQTCFELVRLFYGKPLRTTSFEGSFRDCFKEADAAFQMRNNDLELQVLAGAVIAQSVRGSADLADMIALATVSASYTGLIQPPVPEIVGLAENYLKEESLRVRSRGVLKVNAGQKAMATSLKSVAEVCKSGDMAAAEAPMNSFSNELVKVLKNLEKQVELQQEETDIHWWVFGECSNDLSCKVSDLGVLSACLVVGKELADLTKRIPGPVAAEAFLRKMLYDIGRDLPEHISLEDAVNSVSDKWKEKWIAKVNFEGIEDFCPVRFATSRAVEAGTKEGWSDIFEKHIKIKADVAISPVKLAMQAYQENMLAKAIV